MSCGDYSEVALTNSRALPPDIEDALGKLSCVPSSSKSGAYSIADDPLEPRAMKHSPLREWCEASLEETSGIGRSALATCRDRASAFSIYPVIEDIREALLAKDVVVLIAPTGAGKSLVAPYLAEELAAGPSGPGDGGSSSGTNYRKTMLVAPSVEHCGGTARAFDKLFGRTPLSVSAFFNPYEERVCKGDGKLPRKTNEGDAQFVYCPYSAALRVLPHANLNLLILDEVHEPNDNVQMVAGIARKNMRNTLNKLLLMTATLDESERKRYEEYFTSEGFSFKILDYSAKLERKFKVTMSCLEGPLLPPLFQKTELSALVSSELKSGDVSGRVQSRSLDKDKEFHRVLVALNVAMKLSWMDLHERLQGRYNKHCHMRSILVILPGLEQVERMYSASFKQPNFSNNEMNGFHPVRLTSLVRDDELITSECTKEGVWKGNQGRIVFTTNLITAGLTVPDAAFIIDCGQQKILDVYTKDGLRSLTTIAVDRLIIMQRAGRTGRTIDGEYFLPYSVEEVAQMMQSNHGELLLNRNFEERHFLYKELYMLELLHEPPESLIKELKKSMEIRGLHSGARGFPTDVILMHSLLNFLSTEQARIVIQGVRLGIAAHVIHLVADAISRVRFTRAGSHGLGRNNGPSESASAVHLYGARMDAYKQGNRRDDTLPMAYRGVGDSIALADLLVSFYCAYPHHASRYALERRYAAMANNFWSGCSSVCDGERTFFSRLYDDFVREEGRDAVSRYVSQIEAALRGAGILTSRDRPIFDPRLNRHVVSRDNFCLDEDGRALLVALLTMHSSRVGRLCAQTRKKQPPVYEIYRDAAAYQTEFLAPESAYSQPERGAEPIYGRFSEMFKRRDKYTNLIDPITLKQLAYFLNVNGGIDIRNAQPKGCASVTLKLNASTGKSGIKITMDATTMNDVRKSRKTLEGCLETLTYTTDEDRIASLEQFIIKLWRECEKTEEEDDPPPQNHAHDFSARGASNSALPSLAELKDRDAWGRGAYSAARGAEQAADRGDKSDSEDSQGSTNSAGWY